jgi:hypothetical protein
MSLGYRNLALGTVLALGIAGCGGAGSEPTDAMDHSPPALE